MINKNWMKSAPFRWLMLLAAIAIALLGFTHNPASKTTAQAVAVPTTPPDAAAGLAIYNERCVVCHGEMGDGLGSQAVQAGLEPTAFSAPAYRKTAVPSLMFDIINNGNTAAGMPPFGEASSNPLSETDIWNLVALAQSFGTRPADIAAGEAIATDLGADVANWPGLDYWFSRSDEMVLADLANEDTFGVDLTGLSDEEKLSLVDYGRSLNYTYTDLLGPFTPAEQALLSGQVINGTTNEAVTEGEVRLRAFTVQLEEMYSATTPINSDGSFEFEVENPPVDWVFLADMVYDDLSFNSNAVQVSGAQTVAQMPLFVFETTSNPDVVNIDRLHIVLTFSEARLLVSELYVFSNLETAVYVGETGDPAQGTVAINLPAGAENIDFQRGFGTTLDSFIPATEVVETGSGFADTVPLRPGVSSLNLLVSYDVPYEDGLLLTHPLDYPVSNGSAIMADAGVMITEGGWVLQETQETAGGSFQSFANDEIATADVVLVGLDGRPSQVTDAVGNILPVRNQTSELIIGGVGLVIALAIGFFMVQQWRTAPVLAGEAAHAAPNPAMGQQSSRANGLLQAIANLDDVYEAGELDEAAYQQQRRDLKDELTAVWK